MDKDNIRHYINIVAVAFLFLVFGIWELINPQYWQGFVPSILYSLNITLLIMIHGAVLSLLGIWILIGKWLKIAAIVGTLVMAQIVMSLIISSGFSDIVVRDFTILLFVLSLAFEKSKD